MTRKKPQPKRLSEVLHSLVLVFRDLSRGCIPMKRSPVTKFISVSIASLVCCANSRQEYFSQSTADELQGGYIIGWNIMTLLPV